MKNRFPERSMAQNVSEQERAFSLLGAGALLLSGLRHMSLKRMALGGYLAYRGATGHCPLKEQLERAGFAGRPRRSATFGGPSEDLWLRQNPRDRVEEASMESFPASDAPNYNR
jgi:uncharacterized membrane protein